MTDSNSGNAVPPTIDNVPPAKPPQEDAASCCASGLGSHVRDQHTWLRFVFLLVFGAAFYLSSILIFAVSVFQFLAKLFSGDSFKGLSDFGDNLATYQAQTTRFLTFATDEKPFPFAPFPTK